MRSLRYVVENEVNIDKLKYKIVGCVITFDMVEGN